MTTFILVLACVLIGFFIGYIAGRLSYKELLEKYDEAIKGYADLVSSMTGKALQSEDLIDSLTEVCLNQRETIDDLTTQISEMKIIRLELTSKILDQNLENNRDFLNGLSKN